MNKEHTAEEVRPARTVFRLSHDELIEALTEWIGKHHGGMPHRMPHGIYGVWGLGRERENWAITLVVDHDPLATEVKP